MVQFDPFSALMGDVTLPTRAKGAFATTTTATTSDLHTPPESPKTYGELGTVHPQLRRLSSAGHSQPSHYCTRCHMRRPSQEHLALTRSHSHSPDDESWDGFCPDIHMPDRTPARPQHHTRRHSGLCPQEVMTAQAHHDGRTSPHTQMTIKTRPYPPTASSYHHACHCESVTPTENLTERYGLVEEPEEILGERAAGQMAEIMHEELMADMEAQQMRM